MTSLPKVPRAKIIGLGSYVPSQVVTNDDLSSRMATSDEWIRTRTGIHERRFAADHQGTSDLAVAAARLALHDAAINASELDLIIVATTTPDYYMPGLGVLIQHKLQCRTIPALDLRAQCSGFVWALATADAFSHSGSYRHILVVGADLQSRVLDFSLAGRHTAVLFGDGAGACVIQCGDSSLSSSSSPPPSGLLDHVMGSDGSGCESLFMSRPGFAAHQPAFIEPDDIEQKRTTPHMDGKQVFKHAAHFMEQTVWTLLKNNNLRLHDIDLIIPHQANLRINEMLRTKLKLSPGHMVNVIHKYGNTTSATLPLGMVEAVQDGRLQPGSLIITTAFGSGYTWGGNLIRW